MLNIISIISIGSCRSVDLNATINYYICILTSFGDRRHVLISLPIHNGKFDLEHFLFVSEIESPVYRWF